MFTSQYMNFDEKSRLYPERGPGKTFPVTTPLERTLLIIIAIVVLIGIGLSIGIVSIKKARDRYEKHSLAKLRNETGICYSPSCISEASNLLKSINRSVDPCSDFYSFACGNWIKNAYLVSTLESQFTKLTKIIHLRVKSILEDLEKEENLPDHKKKTRDFYKACMDRDHRNEIGATEFLNDLKKFGGWPLIDEGWDAANFNWSNLMIQLFENGYISNMLFTLKLDLDARNTSRSIIAVMQPSLGLKKKLYYIIPDGQIATSYKKAIFELATHLHPAANLVKKSSMDAIEKAFELESKIADLIKEVSMRYPDQIYNIMTLEELENFAPKIPWRNLLKHLLPPETILTNEERILVTVPSMIKGLNKILEEMSSEQGKRILSNYMFYRTAFFAASNLNTEFYNLIKGVFNTDSVGNNQLWEICVKDTMDLFPLPLTSSYVAKYLKKNTKELLEIMFDDIKNALVDDIKGAAWLDAETKNYALFKVKKMKAAIAYNEEIMKDENLNSFYKEVNVTDNHFSNVKQLIAARQRRNMQGLHKKRDRFRWTDVNNLLTANAYYQPSSNAIIIPVGVLHDTIFAAERPNYINYGSLGMIVGHELTHAFDSIGSLYDADGSYRMWWKEKSWKKFEERVKCYKEQYDKFYLSEADSNVNGTLTLGENIADNGGLQTAYYAYNLLLKRLGSEKSLPGLPYTEKQMFWISFANVWCRKQTEESIHYGMIYSVHSPSRYRIIGSLSNMKEFSEDFNCKLNSTMNPKSKCLLWK